jgi:8-oxo-dGTP pyrophosphatase MutT (NUDIX family)
MANASSPPADQTIVSAATVIVCRNAAAGAPELLMVKRSKTLAFAASAAVFPGGKVAPADLRMAQDDEEHAARIAVVRETLEETGLVICIDRPASADEAQAARAMLAQSEDMGPVLEHFSWSLDTEQLVPFARWLPNFKPGRIFDTRFYLADIGTGAVDLAPDYGENTLLFWISAPAALEQIESGELRAIYPTRRNLERLALFDSFPAIRDHARSVPLVTISPWVEQSAEGEMLCIPQGAGYPVTAAPLSQISLD